MIEISSRPLALVVSKNNKGKIKHYQQNFIAKFLQQKSNVHIVFVSAVRKCVLKISALKLILVVAKAGLQTQLLNFGPDIKKWLSQKI